MNTSRALYFLFLLAIASVAALSSCKEKNDEYPPRIWSELSYTSAGIAPRDVSVIYYENDHSSWLGARGYEGLLHYDGYQWSSFDKVNTGIQFDSVTSITRDGNGTLWVGWKQGLASFNNDTWENISQFAGLCVTSVAVEGIAGIRVGIRGKSGGVASLQNNAWTFYTTSNSDIPSGNTNSLVSDHNQLLWVATADKGITRLRNTVWETMNTGATLLSDDFRCLTLSPDGSIWAGSSASQLIHFDDDTCTILNTGTSKPITSTVVTYDGEVWCSTYGAGLVRFDGKSWTSFNKNDAALPSDDILTLAKGGNGILLFSVPGGKVLMLKL